ncbi:MAG: hypothetical protein U9N81_10155 [Bacillota bacterium]|nr:hypothetical protein [Bacillota bacterium]
MMEVLLVLVIISAAVRILYKTHKKHLTMIHVHPALVVAPIVNRAMADVISRIIKNK